MKTQSPKILQLLEFRVETAGVRNFNSVAHFCNEFRFEEIPPHPPKISCQKF